MNAGQPLSGISVVDVSELLPGPFFTHCLVELGATVVKVERPGHGDLLGVMRPGSYAAINHGKTVVKIDLKDPAGVQAVRDRVATADIFVEGSRPGVMERLGLGYGALSADYPGLIYVSLSGFGQTGPLRHVPGHDLNYQAAAGLLALSGPDESGPAPGVGLPTSDFAGAMYALSACLAALLQRATTGRGQHVDVSITDAITHWLNPISADFQRNGVRTLEQQRYGRFAKPGYAVFQTRDGRWLAVGALESHFLQRLLAALELAPAEPEPGTDRVQQATAINGRIGQRFAQLDAESALKLLNEHDVPVSEVVAPTDVPDTENSRARELFVEVDGLKVARFPVRLEGMG